METLRIESRDSYKNTISTLVLNYEYHDDGTKYYEDGHSYIDEYVTLESVYIELGEYGEVIVPVELNDSLTAQYSELLTYHTGLKVKELMA